ncbi:MAG: hypothetical protein U0232_25560 [Thermomicrobiales bacterium]
MLHALVAVADCDPTAASTSPPRMSEEHHHPGHRRSRRKSPNRYYRADRAPTSPPSPSTLTASRPWRYDAAGEDYPHL